jgi:perosamine synthetase
MSAVADFERAFAEYVGARYCIALCNGTATLHTALVALGVKPGDRVAVPPLTMSATTIAVLHAGAVPVFVDVDPDTWLMRTPPEDARVMMGVSLYGLHWPATRYDYRDGYRAGGARGLVDDAAQTLAPMDYGRHRGYPDFKSYSFQASKILALGEGGMLATNDEWLATRAREFSSLGYRMAADQPRISKAVLKDPAYQRHHTLGWNYRMSEWVASAGLTRMKYRRRLGLDVWGDGKIVLDDLVAERREAAALYRAAISDCSWIRPQHVPDGWTHDYWSFAVALERADLWHPFAEAVERHGGTRPFAAWRLTYQEPAFRHLAEDGCCPVAEDLQPRIVAGQTNDLASAQRNADAWHAAIYELNGVPA